MAQQYHNAMASSGSASVISDEQSNASNPASAPSSTTVVNPSPVENAAPPHIAEQSMALIPTSSMALKPANASVAGMSSVVQPPQRSMPHHLQEGEEAWSVITRSLMVAVMGSQPPAMAASTLLGVFRPIVDEWAGARKEGKRWKERAEVYMAEHHKHKIELAHKHETLKEQVGSLQKRLEESQSREREFESEQSTLRATVTSLEKKLGEAEAEAHATREGHAQAAQESKKEVEAMAKSAKDAKIMYDKLRQEADDQKRAHNAQIINLQEKIKENEAIKTKLEERLGSTIAKTTSLEAAIAQKDQDITNLQTRVSELNTRKEALERQLALYQRIPTRRF